MQTIVVSYLFHLCTFDSGSFSSSLVHLLSNQYTSTSTYSSTNTSSNGSTLTFSDKTTYYGTKSSATATAK